MKIWNTKIWKYENYVYLFKMYLLCKCNEGYQDGYIKHLLLSFKKINVIWKENNYIFTDKYDGTLVVLRLFRLYMRILERIPSVLKPVLLRIIKHFLWNCTSIVTGNGIINLVPIIMFISCYKNIGHHINQIDIH